MVAIALELSSAAAIISSVELRARRARSVALRSASSTRLRASNPPRTARFAAAPTITRPPSTVIVSMNMTTPARRRWEGGRVSAFFD